MQRDEKDGAAGEVAVIGATGFVGRHLVRNLRAAGHRVRAVSRDGARRPEWDGQVRAVAADVERGLGLEEAIDGAGGVVHLVAIARERGGRRFEAVNVAGVRHVIDAMRAVGVRRLVHLSALGVTEDPAFAYLSSKWRGEQLVRSSDTDWVILRPSLVFGEGDGFFNLIKVTLTWWSPGVVGIPGAGDARFQPLAVDDLALAIERCLLDADRAGSTHEIGGPEYLSYREIVDRVMSATGKRRFKVGVPIALLRGVTAVTDRVLPIFPVSSDQIGSLVRPNFTELDAFERAFGVAPRPLDLAYLRS